VGSVGQPRDGDPRAAYGVIDLETRTLELRRVTYDVAAAQRRILEEGLPGWLADRLSLGR
jgi:diadenosine tetraphosphatase ApaH/serine/threonine PP2A family protein phosphatase